MATYTSDLTSQVVNAADSISGWSELASPHASGSAPAVDTENFYHNAASVSQGTGQASGQGAGIQYLSGSALTWTAASNWCVFFWTYYTAPTNIASWSSGGLRVGVGDADNDAHMFNAMGVDFDLLPLACWQSTAIDPEATSDQTIGTVTSSTTYQNFAILPNVNAKITKGSPTAADVIRYGRGQLLSTGASCLFSGMATFNDNATTGRYGLFTALGSGYRWKGLMQFGDASTTCTMSDSNTAISVEDTPRVLSGFNAIEVYNSGSSITWTSVGITGVQTSITGSAPVSKGTFEAVDNATISLTGCTFTDMGTFIYQSNSTITDSVYRRCEEVLQGSASISGCSFDSSTGTEAVTSTVSALSSLTGNTFNSGGSGYAVELGTTTDSTTINWDNQESGYTGTPGTVYTTGTGDETIHITYNGAGTKDIAVVTGASTPTVHNSGTGTVTVTAGQVTTTVEVLNPDGSILTSAGQANEVANVLITAASGGPLSVGTQIIKGTTNATTGIITDTRTLASDQPITGWVRKTSVSPFYKQGDITGTIDSADGIVITVKMVSDE